MNGLIIIGLLVFATALLVTERLRADMVAMLTLAILVMVRILDPQEALSGFSNPATIAVACMFVLSAGLQGSGVVTFVADRFLHYAPEDDRLLLLLTAAVVAPVSAFINNTAAVAIFLPVVAQACHARQISPSRLMMPLSFFAMLGGTCTLIGTSTNLLVSSIAEERGLERFGMFEFTEIGVLLLAVGGVYLLLFSNRFVPDRVQAKSLTEGHRLNTYLSEVVVLEESPLIGSTLHDARFGERFDLEVLGHVRNKVMRSVPPGYDQLLADDILLVKAPASALLKLRDSAGIAVRPGRKPEDADLGGADSTLVEAIVTPNSQLESRTLQGVNFRNRFGATALAIRRHGEDIREKIGKTRLKVGDELLILCRTSRLEQLRTESDFVILQELDLPVLQPLKMLVATLIVIGVVAAATMDIYPIADAALVGAVAMVITGCVHARKVYTSIDWRVIFLLAGLLPLGIALEKTQVAQQAADTVVALTGGWGPHAVLSVFFLLSALLTGIMSNTATAALLAPLAISTAAVLGVDARPFLIALTFAASAAYYTPIGYQTNLLVYGPGGYRFVDFVRLGGPLTLLYWLMASLLIPRFFPF